MEVIRSKNAGACYGVQRALDLALKASEGDGSAFTLGPLIHNPQVVANLEARGVMAVSEPEQATHGAIIIRSHGVTPAVRRSVEARGLPVIDATCPHVARAQKAAATLAEECGYVVVVGEEGHPEVEGLVAYAHEAGAQVHVAETAADLPIDLPERVGVVVQTTQTRDALDDVLEGIRAQGVAAQVKDTVLHGHAPASAGRRGACRADGRHRGHRRPQFGQYHASCRDLRRGMPAHAPHRVGRRA